MLQRGFMHFACGIQAERNHENDAANPGSLQE